MQLILAFASLAVQVSTPSTVTPSAIVRAAAQQPFARAIATSSQSATIFPSTTLAYFGQILSDTASGAAAMRAAATKEETLKAAQAQKALQRAQNAREGKCKLWGSPGTWGGGANLGMHE